MYGHLGSAQDNNRPLQPVFNNKQHKEEVAKAENGVCDPYGVQVAATALNGYHRSLRPLSMVLQLFVDESGSFHARKHMLRTW